MAKLHIDEIEPGMVLATDLIGPGGMLLLPKGLILAEGHIESVRRRGVTEADVDVEGDGAPDQAAALDPELLKEAEEYVAPFFAFSDMELPATVQIYKIAVNYAARRMASGNRPPKLPPVNARAESMGDLFFRAEGTAESLVRDEVTLATFPDIYFKIREILDSDVSTARDIADMVGKDTSLTAKLLKLVNSPFYGFPKKVDSISRGVMVIGGNEISMLALGISAINAFKDIPPELMNMKDFWVHSVACGTCAKALGAAIGGPPAERLFVAGMLHDIGRLVLFKKLPHAATEAIYYAQANLMPLYEAERDVIGFTHAEVGSLLMREWKFPDELTRIVKCHHEPLTSQDKTEAAIIQVADMLAMAMGYTPRGSVVLAALNDEVWRLLKLPPERLPEIAETAESQLSAIMSAFFGSG